MSAATEIPAAIPGPTGTEPKRQRRKGGLNAEHGRWAVYLIGPTILLLAIVIVVGSVVHGILIEGTMETVSKAALCALVLAATIKVMADLRVRRKRGTLRGENIR